MASKGDIQRRREIRAVEAKRDDLSIKQQKNREELAATKAKLKALRSSR